MPKYCSEEQFWHRYFAAVAKVRQRVRAEHAWGDFDMLENDAEEDTGTRLFVQSELASGRDSPAWYPIRFDSSTTSIPSLTTSHTPACWSHLYSALYALSYSQVCKTVSTKPCN